MYQQNADREKVENNTNWSNALKEKDTINWLENFSRKYSRWDFFLIIFVSVCCTKDLPENI